MQRRTITEHHSPQKKMHPYAQGGWTRPANSDVPRPSNLPPQPSIFGALPDPFRRPQTQPPNLLPFTFTDFQPNILTCAVTGGAHSHSRVYFHIATDNPRLGFTVFHDSAGQPIAVIEWLKNPVLEIRGIVPKRNASAWLAVSQDGSHRKMEALGKHFVWVPGGEYIFLYAAGVGQPQAYAQISRGKNSVTLEMTPEAIQIGLLEICVVATFLLQCGRPID
ncbi:hypothetical protein R3P38DRAFT_2857956 [Favolaschia claudopus]|uniref:Uncharacterized protein n=1 Tax=Favolaschia claudopus TaxID=2862362 RepID=A0AAW0DL15_9AGAR